MSQSRGSRGSGPPRLSPSQRWGDVGLVKPSAPSDPLYDWDSQGAHLPQTGEARASPRREMADFFPSPGCPASQFGGRRGRGPTEEGEKAPEHAWSPESGPGGNPCLQTPLPVKDVKKKKTHKKLVLPFCLPSPSARPMAPPDCLRVGCAPSKWLPSSSAEPRGPGILDTGVGEGCRAGEETASSPACAGLGRGCGGVGPVCLWRAERAKRR